VVTAYLLAQTIVTPVYGKLSDLYGRKRVLQAAIVIFLIGSMLCGLAQSMPELIVFRAVQGLGGGGLMVGAQAALGDVVSPRQRGRYTGLFIAIFGAASVAGPLLGGFITTNLNWRWIFYINLPVGLAALVVLAVAFPRIQTTLRPSIDYLGAGLLAIGLTGVVLVTTLGGTSYGWTSPMILGLGVVGVAALIGFFVTETRVAAPILPPRLWKSRTFTLTSIVGFIIGFALYGAVTFLPLFQQVVRGASPTASGLQLVPLMGGLIVSSVVSGRMIAASGKYRRYPIAGTGITVAGLALLARMGPHTSTLAAAAYMVVLGLGLGMVMQVLILAVQNDAPYEDLGVATAGATLFRSIGGSLGTAALGAIFTNRLIAELSSRIPSGAGAIAHSGSVDPAAVASLPAPIKSAYLDGFSAALGTVFMAAAGVAVLAFALTWLMPEVALRTTLRSESVDADDDGDGSPAPETVSSVPVSETPDRA